MSQTDSSTLSRRELMLAMSAGLIVLQQAEAKAALVQAPATAGAVESAASSTMGDRWTAPRRVVAVRAADGVNRVLADGPSPASFELNGTRITRLWETNAVPAALPVTADVAPVAGSAYRAGFAGSSFYVAEIPPGVGRQQIPLHRNATIDYMAILRGEIFFLLPEREVRLRQGDTLVQCGCDHSWENRGTESCMLLFVVIPAQTDG